MSTRMPLLLDDPVLRQLIDANSRTSEKLARELRTGGVDPATLPAFTILKLDRNEQSDAAESIEGLISSLASDDDVIVRSAATEMHRLLADQSVSGADPRRLAFIIGESLFRERTLPSAARVTGVLKSESREPSSVVWIEDGFVRLRHRSLGEACAAAWYVDRAYQRDMSIVGLDVPSDLVRRLAFVQSPVTPASISDQARVDIWTGPGIVGPAHEATVRSLGSPVQLAAKSATVVEYLDFLRAIGTDPGQWLPSGAPHVGVLQPLVERMPNGRVSDPAQGALPMTTVSWWGATAYSAWVGGRLPTSLEWELAARGADGRMFPWGDHATRDTANCADHWADDDLIGYEAWKARMDQGSIPTGGVSQAGMFPHSTSACGAVDMGGNHWEWTSTTLPSGRAVIAGGSYDNPLRALRASTRGYYSLGGRSNAVGFRVAFDGMSSSGG